MKHVRELFHPSVRLVAQCVGNWMGAPGYVAGADAGMPAL